MTQNRLLWLLLAVAACDPAPPEHGHDHGDNADHAEDGAAEAPTIAVTRWTATHELFVELDAPVAGQAFAYHAHVTRLADNHAADAGTLRIRFEQDGFAVESHTDETVARSGIFAQTAPAPAKPGPYTLVFDYTHGDERASWSAGAVQVGAGTPVAHPGEDEGDIAFLKESQWQVPFGVAPAQARALAPTIEAAGVVRADPTATAVVAAPVGGLLVWTDGLPAVGRQVERGERLATLLPAGAAADWSVLQAEARTARIDRDLAEADVRRIEGLEPDALVSSRRADEARAAFARAVERKLAADRRLSALSSASSGAVAVRAPATGTLVSVGGHHGEAVEAGAPLVRVATQADTLIDAHVHARGPTGLRPVASLTVDRGGDGGPIDLLAAGAAVLPERLVYDPDTLSAPLAVRVPAAAGLQEGELVELEVAVGSATPMLAIPRDAVVEINGQDVVFVQKTGESFARRRVELGRRDATHVAVLDGVEEGEMVVVEGGFDVHVASLSGALESHRH